MIDLFLGFNLDLSRLNNIHPIAFLHWISNLHPINLFRGVFVQVLNWNLSWRCILIRRKLTIFWRFNKTKKSIFLICFSWIFRGMLLWRFRRVICLLDWWCIFQNTKERPNSSIKNSFLFTLINSFVSYFPLEFALLVTVKR